MRLFLAINLDAALRRAIHEATAPLRAALPSASWVREDRLHLTLKFLGEQSMEEAASVAASMSGVASRHQELPMRLGGVGTFPNPRRPRVVWMGVSHEPRLELLQHDVELACEALGYEIEGRAFRPHLTLARLRERPDALELRAFARAAKMVDFEEEVDVRSIDLMSSEHSEAGHTYRMLASAPLRSA